MTFLQAQASATYQIKAAQSVYLGKCTFCIYNVPCVCQLTLTPLQSENLKECPISLQAQTSANVMYH